MSEKRYWLSCDGDFYDEELDKCFFQQSLEDLLNQQDQEIQELKKDKDDLKYFQKLEIQQIYNEKNAEIELYEKKLSNAIVPKFKIGQKVYKVYTPNQKYPFEFKIIGFKITKSKGEDNIFYNVEEDGFDMGWYPDEILFATKEEAQAKLLELKGE